LISAIRRNSLETIPNCHGNLADYVPVCPYCGVVVDVPHRGAAHPAWSVRRESSGKATASMVCGILFFLWPFTAVAAVILGHIALSEIKKSAGRLAGRGMAMVGLILGYIGVAFVPCILIIAAIAIPNLLRSRMAVNEASAVERFAPTTRPWLTTRVHVQKRYPKDLASLDPAIGDR